MPCFRPSLLEFGRSSVWERSILGLHINFYKSELSTFLGLYQDTVDMSLSLPADKLPEIEHLDSSLFQTQSLTVWQVIIMGKTNFCTNVQIQIC